MTATCLQIAVAAGLSSVHRKGAGEVAFVCPIHNDHNPSLFINERKNCFFCGPCGVGGGPWKLATFLSGIDADDTKKIARWLSERGL